MLEPAVVARRLLALAPGAPQYLVGFSGGQDSLALLHALAGQAHRLPGSLEAVHVHHGLYEAADQWEEHCRLLADQLGVPLHVVRVQVPAGGGEGVEAAARRVRYEAFAARLQPGGCLVLAHHADDQAETFLFRALRRAGLQGLTAAPERRPLHPGVVVRPLLDTPCEALSTYLGAHRLLAVEDPSNTDERHDRVFLRRRVVPALRGRWDDAAQRLSASVAALAADRVLLEAYLDDDLARARQGHGNPSVRMLREWSRHRRQAVFRRWLQVSGCRAPPARRLAEGLDGLLAGDSDQAARLEWSEGVVCRYRDRLHLLPRGQEGGPSAAAGVAAPVEVVAGAGNWAFAEGRVEAVWSPVGLGPEGGHWTLCPRCRLRGAARKRAQKLFQHLGVPPWHRDDRPLVMEGDRPTAVPGYGVVAGRVRAPGIRLTWHPAGGSGS